MHLFNDLVGRYKCDWTLIRLPFDFHLTAAELTMGQWVMGQMGQQIWVGHVGHGSVTVTR